MKLDSIQREEGKMSTLVITNNQQVVTTSLTVAETFGKQHRHALESIEDLITGGCRKVGRPISRRCL